MEDECSIFGEVRDRTISKRTSKKTSPKRIKEDIEVSILKKTINFLLSNKEREYLNKDFEAYVCIEVHGKKYMVNKDGIKIVKDIDEDKINGDSIVLIKKKLNENG